MIVEDFGQLVYQQFCMIYGNKTKYNESLVQAYKKMIKNHLEHERNGGKIYSSRGNKK